MNPDSGAILSEARAGHLLGQRKGSLDRLLAFFRTGALFVWKYFVGVALCQSLVGAILVVGWTYRLMQRCALRRWWKQSHVRNNGETFEQFVTASHLTACHVAWPNWIVGPNAWNEIRQRRADGVRSRLGVALRVAAR